MAVEKIRAVLVIEILGRPPEYITETLGKLLEEIEKQPEIKVVSKNMAEPKATEVNKEIFTTFAEIEVETNLMKLMSLIYNFMPSHVEIITPEEFKIRNSDLNTFFNELVNRLHRYDEIAKSLLLERQTLADKIKSGEIKLKDVDMNAEKKVRKKKT